MGKLRIYTQNTRGLNTKIRYGFRNKITLLNYDIYALTESWIQSNVESSELFDSTYTVHRADRILNDGVGRGGGVILAIKNNIS